MKSSKKAFTLVELIIVIAIIAILAVTAFLMLTKWIAKSRDSSRLSDINTIDNALQVYLTEKSSLPKPENYTLIYASGTYNIVGYQGDFSDNVAKSLGNLTKAPKDALDNTYYNYYLDSTSTKYQLLGYTEQTSSVSSTANAVDYSTRYVRIAGDKLGILTDVNNAPVNRLGLTGLDIALTTGIYKAYFDSSTSVSGTGSSLVSMMTLNNKNISYLDTGLVFYSDMETTINSGGLMVLKDLSSYANNGICYNSGTSGNCGSVGPSFVDGVKGKAMQFDGSGNYVKVLNNTSIKPTKQFTVSLSFNSTSLITGYYNLIQNGNNWTDMKGINIRQQRNGNVLQPNLLGVGVATGSSNGSKWLYKPIIYNNQWVNVSVKYDGYETSIYQNGILIGKTSYGTQNDIINDSLDLFIGRCASAAACYFNGSIDEVRIYNRALSDDEVKTLYITN